jgi:hypothetical protein
MMHMVRRFHTYSIGLLGRNTRESEMRARHVARMGEECEWESQKERDHLKDQGIDGRMGSEWILGRSAGGV